MHRLIKSSLYACTALLLLASSLLTAPASAAGFGAATPMTTARGLHTTTQLPSGKVLVAGGNGLGGYLSAAELFDSGLAPIAVLEPALTSTNAFLLQTSQLAATSSGSATSAVGAVTATGFAPRLEGSGSANNNSASNRPVFQVQRIDNDQMRFIANDATVNITDTSFTGSATAFAGFPAGPVRVRVWVNGVPSAERISVLAVAPGTTAAPTATGGVL